jgi:hypothetical protein
LFEFALFHSLSPVRNARKYSIQFDILRELAEKPRL